MKLFFFVSITIFLALSISLVGYAGEIREIQASPKLKIIENKYTDGVFQKINYKIQFYNEKGKIKKEIDLSDDSVTRISVSPKAKKVVFTNNKHRKYNQKELEIMKKEKKPYPKDYWHFLQDVNMYNENGKKDKIIQTDIEINNIFCTDEGEITAIGRMQPVPKYRGKQILMFYDKKSKLVKIINEEEAKEKKIRVEGIGKIYQENKLVWVNSLETPLKGSTITLFDIKGNIVWQYYNTYLSVFYWNNIYFLPNSNHIYVEGHYPDLSAREKSVRKTWVLDQNGNCVKLLDGWDNQK